MQDLSRYPELFDYDEKHHRFYFSTETESENLNTLGCYEIVFDADGERYYCYISSTDFNKALRAFFFNHPHISYDMILDHTEVKKRRPS